MAHLLDNAVWAALNSGNKNLALGTAQIKYYPAAVAFFAGMEQYTTENLRTLYEITPAENKVFGIVDTKKIDIPEPWTIANHIPLVQMVYLLPAPNKVPANTIVPLSAAHIPQMLELTKLTNPGPFRERTIDLGYYEGIFDGDRLVAMAGQRMHATPFAEISAVCTHPDYTGRGYAKDLMISQLTRIKQSRETPFLHVATANERAISIYESLGFVKRKELFIYVITK